MKHNGYRRTSGLTCLAAAGIVFTLGLGAAIATQSPSAPYIADPFSQECSHVK